jgi:alanine-glyoxylate transaminase/serine-glyoxylate transaminase/serine-pyruvate transaminase
MSSRFKLFTPGPCEVDPDVLAAMAGPVMRHYGPEWLSVFAETTDLAKQVFQTRNELLIMPGTGTSALDMALGSMLASGEKVIVGSNGYFGDRLIAIARAYGLEVVVFRSAWGKPLSPIELETLLDQHPDARAVAVVHHETSTSVLNPLCELAEISHRTNRAIVVDAISSLGGMDLPVDAWGIDACVVSANKCLETPPGVTLLSLSPRASSLIDAQDQPGHGWYLSVKTWRQYAADGRGWHPYPVTLPTNNIFGLRASLRKILTKGLEAHWARYRWARQAVRKGMCNIGFELLVPDEYAAPTATAVKARPEFPIASLIEWLARERSMLVGGGLGELRDKVFRVGHMGQASTRGHVLGLLFAVEEFLRLQGISVPIGASLVGAEHIQTE